MEQEEKKKIFEDILELRVIYQGLDGYAKQHKCVVRLDEPYSIERIRKAVGLYKNEELTEEYFFLWCKLCAREIKQYCTEYSHESLAKQEIAKRLLDMANGQDASVKLQEIEDFHRVVIGESKSPFLLAEDLEVFYAYQAPAEEYDDDDEDIAEILSINHYRKTFSLSRDYISNCEEYYDGLEGYMIPQYVSKVIFDLLCANMHTLGYKEEKDEV